MQREIRCLPNQYVEQESIHLRQTSDSNLQQILDLPLPSIHDEFLYQSMDPWTAASLDVRFEIFMLLRRFRASNLNLLKLKKANWI